MDLTRPHPLDFASGMMKRSVFLAGAAAASFSPCAVRAADVAPFPLVVAPPSGTDAGALYYAMQQGWFQQVGLQITAIPGNGAAAMPGVIGGSVQFAYANVYSLAEAHVKGIPIVLVAPGIAYVSATAFQQLLVNGDGPIRGQKDLVGKIVAVSSLGDMAAFTVQSWLNKGGVDPATVHFVELKVSAMPDALLQRRVDAIAVYDPFMSAALDRGARVIGKPFDSIALNFLEAAWFTTRDFASVHHDVVQKFASVIIRAAQYFDIHYNDLIPMISDFTKLSPDTLRKEAPEYVATSLNPAMIQPVIDAAARYHAIPSNFPAKDLIFS